MLHGQEETFGNNEFVNFSALWQWFHRYTQVKTYQIVSIQFKYVQFVLVHFILLKLINAVKKENYILTHTEVKGLLLWSSG